MKIKKALNNLSQMIQSHRVELWILLIFLTTTILIFPIQLRYEYYPIQSIHVFGDMLPLFSVVYHIWLATLLLLLFFSGENNNWQRLVLCAIFILGFFGLWIISTAGRGHFDEFWQMAQINYLGELGKIEYERYSYLQFPGFHLLNLSLSQICGINLLTTRTLFLIVNCIMFAVLLYLLLEKLFKNPILSSLGTLLIIQGAIDASGSIGAFWPGNVANLIFLLLLILLSRRNERTLSMSKALIIIILLAGFVIMYVPTEGYFIFILMGIYLLQKMVKQQIVEWPIIVLFIVLFLSWEIYSAVQTFNSLAELIPAFLTSFTNFGERFSYSILGPATKVIGGVVPLWETIIRYFWLILTYGIGTGLGIWNLVKFRRIKSAQIVETGGLLGCIVISAVLYFSFAMAGPAKETTVLRYLRYAPFFTIPILLRFLYGFSQKELPPRGSTLGNSNSVFIFNGWYQNLCQFGGWLRNHTLILLIILVFVLSLPTSLISARNINILVTYPYEIATGEFLQSTYQDEELHLFSSATGSAYYYFVPDLYVYVTIEPEMMSSGEILWADVDRLVSDFENTNYQESLFLLSDRFRLPVYYPTAIARDNPNWIELVNRLVDNNKIYDNMHTELYQHKIR